MKPLATVALLPLFGSLNRGVVLPSTTLQATSRSWLAVQRRQDRRCKALSGESAVTTGTNGLGFVAI